MQTEYQGIYYEGVKFNTKEVNRNFKIKIFGVNNDRAVNKLVGVRGLIEEVGNKNLVNSLLLRAFKSTTDKVVCKLRRGLQITFYRH